jgi:hypothetical protein
MHLACQTDLVAENPNIHIDGIYGSIFASIPSSSGFLPTRSL